MLCIKKIKIRCAWLSVNKEYSYIHYMHVENIGGADDT